MALTAVRNRIAYTGLCFTSHHKDMVMARLLDQLSAGSLKAGDKWYDPNLVKTLIGASKKNKATGGDDGNEAPKKKPKAHPKANPKKAPKDPKEAKDPKDTKPKHKKKGKKPAPSDGGGTDDSNVTDMLESSEGEGWE